MLSRSQLYKEFNYSERICSIYDKQEKRKELLTEVAALEREVQEEMNQLPDEIITLYEQMQVIDTLAGGAHDRT